ncbi:MAG TPA: hypothetical protein VFZ61_14820 [Polyangiales bacterium]
MTRQTKQTTWCLAAFAFLALSAFAVSAPSVKAWGPWGAWAPQSQFSTCSGVAGSGTTIACTGKAGVAGALLAAYTPLGDCGQATQAYGFPKLSNGQYFSVIAQNTKSAHATAPISFTHSICRCRYDIC